MFKFPIKHENNPTDFHFQAEIKLPRIKRENQSLLELTPLVQGKQLHLYTLLLHYMEIVKSLIHLILMSSYLTLIEKTVSRLDVVYRALLLQEGGCLRYQGQMRFQLRNYHTLLNPFQALASLWAQEIHLVVDQLQLLTVDIRHKTLTTVAMVTGQDQFE